MARLLTQTTLKMNIIIMVRDLRGEAQRSKITRIHRQACLPVCASPH